VVGLTEAALMSACLLGKRFSIVAISHRITAWYRECVAANGLSDRLASIRNLDNPLQDIGRVQEDHSARLEALCLSAVQDDGADVIIIAGAPLAGLARSIRDRIPVPVVDGVSSAVCHAQTLVSLGTLPARQGSFAPPPIKPHHGLPEGIGRLLARDRKQR
jgi:Asp/Glu/hydantoin racemase